MRTTRHVVRDEQGAITQLVEAPASVTMTGAEFADQCRRSIDVIKARAVALRATVEHGALAAERLAADEYAIAALESAVEVCTGAARGQVHACRDSDGRIRLTGVDIDRDVA